MARAEEIALKLLQQEGVAGIWELQMRAAAVYREGERDAAEALIEIADAAEEIYGSGFGKTPPRRRPRPIRPAGAVSAAVASPRRCCPPSETGGRRAAPNDSGHRTTPPQHGPRRQKARHRTSGIQRDLAG